MRHKVLRGYSVDPSRALKGIAEADETFFLYSEKGDPTVSKRRRPRKRGGKAKKAGINDEQVPVIVGCDRQGELILGVAGRGRVSVKQIEQVLGNHIDPEATLCTDSHPSFRKFAKTHHLKFKPVNISKGQRVVKGIYAAGGRAPRVYPWVNEPGGGTLPPWNIERRHIVFTG